MLKYSGHPLVDVGLATIVAFADKRTPEQLTEADMEAIANYMARQYTVNPMRSFLQGVAFMNSGFTNPAYYESPEKQEVYANNILYAFRAATPRLEQMDVFLNLPVADVPYDVMGIMGHGKTYRQHIPLLTGEDVINFFPGGDAGMPVSGEAILAIQALPLGCAKSAGRLLCVHSDNPHITRYFAGKFLRENRIAIQLAQEAGSSKLGETRLSLRTLVIQILIEACEQQDWQIEDERPFSVSVYHLSNGQTPALDIYHLPLEIVGFLREMLTVDFRQDWEAIVRRGRAAAVAAANKTKKKDSGKDTEPGEPRRNPLFEDIFSLPESAPRFIRRYMLPFALHLAKDGVSQAQPSYSVWKIVESFLWRIMHMEKERIEQIRSLGDQLADYVANENDKRFFRAFYTERRYDFLRNILIRANLAHVRHGYPPIITLDPYISIFEEGVDQERGDWRLARDLVLIRMVEKLYTLGWLSQNVEEITEPEAGEVENVNEQTE